jgi:predicted lipoprotein with Yx(FWY)xxD motif
MECTDDSPTEGQLKGAGMTRIKPITFLATAAVIPLTALAVAGCGGGNDTAGSSGPPKTANGRAATVGVENSSLGKILDDTRGRTLYLFKKDSGTKSACAGACASAWPPLRASVKPAVGVGATASMLGTSPRSDGKPQVTYNGHPLYTYSGDQNPGDTNGQGLTNFGGGWFAVSPAGNQVSGNASGATGGGGGVY